jgi:hypothetical protein
VTYVVDITLSLIRVLEAAAFFRDERMAGYAANADFWAGEVRHALNVIAGHDSRLAIWRSAVLTGPAEAQVSAADLARLSKRLKSAATRFFRLCSLERGRVLEIEQLLGIEIHHISQENRD